MDKYISIIFENHFKSFLEKECIKSNKETQYTLMIISKKFFGTTFAYEIATNQLHTDNFKEFYTTSTQKKLSSLMEASLGMDKKYTKKFN